MVLKVDIVGRSVLTLKERVSIVPGSSPQFLTYSISCSPDSQPEVCLQICSIRLSNVYCEPLDPLAYLRLNSIVV